MKMKIILGLINMKINKKKYNLKRKIKIMNNQKIYMMMMQIFMIQIIYKIIMI